MRTRTRASAVGTTLILTALVLGCGDGRTLSPSVSPSPTPSIPTGVSRTTLYTLSGMVFEVTSAGNTPVEGVEVYCEPCGPPEGHSLRVTDADGAYSFDGVGGVAAGPLQLLLAKRGYVLPNHPDQSGPEGTGWMAVPLTITGDRRFDIQIVRK